MLVVFLCIFVIEWDFILFCLLTAVRASSSISPRVGPKPLAHLLTRKQAQARYCWMPAQWPSHLHVFPDRGTLIVSDLQAKSPWSQGRCPHPLSLVVQTKHSKPVSLIILQVAMLPTLGQWDKGEVHQEVSGKILPLWSRIEVEREKASALHPLPALGSCQAIDLVATEYTTKLSLPTEGSSVHG